MKNVPLVFRIASSLVVLSCTVSQATAERPPDRKPSNSDWRAAPNRDRLPPALRDVPLERLSSGALLRLDLNGDLVEPTAAWSSRVQAIESADTRTPKAAVALDRRVGANIRLGDDPAGLPSTQR